MEALACVGNIAKAMGPSMEPHVRSLMDVMFSVGLSSTLVEALENVTSRSSERHLVNYCYLSFLLDRGFDIRFLLILQYSIFASNDSSAFTRMHFRSSRSTSTSSVKAICCNQSN